MAKPCFIASENLRRLLRSRHNRKIADRAHEQWASCESMEVPYEPESMGMHEANPDVNSTRNNGPEMFKKPLPRDLFESFANNGGR